VLICGSLYSRLITRKL